MKNKAVFLDRDGTIAEDVHYCRRVEDFKLFPDVPKAIRKLNTAGFAVIVVTNQSGIGRGYFDEVRLGEIHEKMIKELGLRGAYLERIYYCPHHPDDCCQCRKPNTLLFEQAVKDFNIDLAKSFVVGDMQLDIDVGVKLGCKTVSVGELKNGADYHAGNIKEVADWILEQPS